jgi:iron complex transport system ATP-binding protein
MDHQIKITNASAGYGGHIVLHQVDLMVQQGERIIVTGSNGSGKSTLLKLIAGTKTATKGSVEVLGYQMSKSSSRQAVTKRIGILTQVQTDPLIAITVEEHVLLGLWGTSFSWLRRPSGEDRAKALRKLELVDMDTLADRDIRTLSGGQRQRVALACALVRDPQLVLMDEPTTYLDTDAKEDILFRINELQKELSFTSIMVTHEMQDGIKADRTIRIAHGSLEVLG